MSIIKDLKIKNEDYTIINSSEKWINNLSKVNIFVGANNSGKSRFMRSLFYPYKDCTLKFLPNDEMFEKFQDQSFKLKNSMKQPSNLPESTDQRRAKQDIIKSLHDIEYLEESNSPYPELINIYNKSGSNDFKNPMSYKFQCNEIFKEFFSEIDFNDNLFRYSFYRIYIPSLRGLVPLIPIEYNSYDGFNGDLYAERIKNDYFPESHDILVDVSDFLGDDDENSRNRTIDLEEAIKKNYFSKHSISTGLHFYEYVKNYLLGNLRQREIIKDYENYLSETFFNNREVALIPKVKDDVLTIKIGDEKERPIYDLGEGIQSIILITLPLFLYLDISNSYNTNVLVFIEEPEVGLHPGLQRILIETLLDERFENYQFFFTTHSNHFIDMTLEEEDISVYLFEKIFKEGKNIPNFKINKIDFESNLVLESLGVLPSSLLLTNCKIFVEGSYDIPHYDAYLNLYQDYLIEQDSDNKKYTRDIHYKFLRGGGKNELAKTIKELDDVEKQRIFLILDFDNESDKEEYESKFRGWGYHNYCILDVREVENLISKNILLEILNEIPQISELGINDDFDEENYQQSYFYDFIKNEIIVDEIPRNFFTKNTFKKRFSKKEKTYLNCYSDLSEPAKKIAKKVYEFIDKNNS